MQGRKPEEEIQRVAILHVYAKISHNMRNQEEEKLQNWVKDNLAHPAKSHHAKFYMVYKIFLCTDSIRFLSLDFYVNYYFLLIINKWKDFLVRNYKGGLERPL